jgi:hypothetical protein
MKLLITTVLALFLASCAPSPHIAFNDAEGIKATYEDARLTEFNQKYRASLKDIYARYRQAGINIYREGIGFTKLSDRDGNSYYYLMVMVKPAELSFDGNSTKSEQRLTTIIKRHFEPHFRYLTVGDLQKDDVDGLAFGVYWPVRDYEQCSSYGGFLEYVVVYLRKADAIAFLNRNVGLDEMLRDAEITTSLGLKNPVPIRLVD